MLTTRCGACGTRFRLTLEQLDARGGRVRCGTCRAVFDARESLQLEDAERQPDPWAAAPSGPPAVAPGDSSVVRVAADPPALPPADTMAGDEGRREPPADDRAGPDQADVTTATPDDADSFRVADTADPATEAARDSTFVATPATAWDTPDTARSTTVADAEATPDTAADAGEVGETAIEEKPAIEPAPPAGADDAAPEASPSPADSGVPVTAAASHGNSGATTGAAAGPGIRPAARPLRSALDRPFDFGPPARRRPRPLLWGLGCLLLLVVLAAQAAYFWRGTIALIAPETKPHLELACARLGCELPLPRRADLMSIESSDLQGHPNNPSVMVLAATLRNRAPFAQAFPALELTLTDDRERSLARRVLLPADYLGAEAADPEGFPGNSERPVRVFMEASSLHATGYRLYLFYP